MGYMIKYPSSLAPMAELKLLNGELPSALRDSDWNTWVLEDETVWQSDFSWIVTVPEGFMTDFASIPRPFRNWQQGGVGPQRIAAYFHDWLYSSQSTISRKESDIVFRDVMEYVAQDTWRNKFRRNAMYYALRIGGIFAWRSNQKKYREFGKEWRMLK